MRGHPISRINRVLQGQKQNQDNNNNNNCEH